MIELFERSLVVVVFERSLVFEVFERCFSVCGF